MQLTQAHAGEKQKTTAKGKLQQTSRGDADDGFDFGKGESASGRPSQCQLGHGPNINKRVPEQNTIEDYNRDGHTCGMHEPNALCFHYLPAVVACRA
jgi:hypothetical protein